jgi:hypothetical protein
MQLPDHVVAARDKEVWPGRSYCLVQRSKRIQPPIRIDIADSTHKVEGMVRRTHSLDFASMTQKGKGQLGG